MNIYRAMMMGVSAYALALRAPESDGGSGGGGGSDSGSGASSAPSGGQAEGAAAPAGAPGSTALGGAAAPAPNGSTEGQPGDAAAQAANGSEGATGGSEGGAQETAEEKAAREARENETPEQKAEREAAEAEEAKKHAPAEGKYEPFTLPDGFELNEEDQKSFSEFAVANDMNQERAQQAIDLYLAQRQKENQVWFDQVAKWRDDSEADAEIGGKDRPAKLATMIQARDMFGRDPELISLMETAGIGDHPALQRFFYRIGKQFGGGAQTVRGDGPAGNNASLGSRLYG